MTFSKYGFVTAIRGPGPTPGTKSNGVHYYVTNDTAANVEGEGYFNDMALYVGAGDTIHVAGDLDGTAFQKSYVVASVSAAGVVVVTPAANVSYLAKQHLHYSAVPLTDGTYQLGTALVAGTIDLINTLLGAAITTNDAVLTFKINGTAITNGAVTIATAGSAAGDLDTVEPSAENVVAVGDKITVVVSGTPGGSKTCAVDMLLNPS